jgi:plastocyanin
MSWRRRGVLGAAAALLAGLAVPRLAPAEEEVVVIRMTAAARGEHVAFDPVGVALRPGQLVRWIGEGETHTATSYKRRIPDGAKPWDSGYLLPGQSFELRLARPGVYDYFCRPHHAAGMVGRLVVGAAAAEPDYPLGEVPSGARRVCPSVAEILARGRV